MNNSKHTPRPWTQYGKLIVGPAHTDGNVFTDHIAQVYKRKNQDANAALIAAAPEMLEALELAQHIIFDASKKLRIPIYGDFETESDQYNYICAVIAKAKGVE